MSALLGERSHPQGGLREEPHGVDAVRVAVGCPERPEALRERLEEERVDHLLHLLLAELPDDTEVAASRVAERGRPMVLLGSQEPGKDGASSTCSNGRGRWRLRGAGRGQGGSGAQTAAAAETPGAQRSAI